MIDDGPPPSADPTRTGPPPSAGLTHQECLSLLAGGGVGRIAVNIRALPTIVPVRFWLDHDQVMFRMSAEATLDRATRDAVIAFQTDGRDDAGPWSIALTGIAHHVAARVPEGPPSWPDVTQGGAATIVAVTTDHVTGRRGALEPAQQL